MERFFKYFSKLYSFELLLLESFFFIETQFKGMRLHQNDVIVITLLKQSPGCITVLKVYFYDIVQMKVELYNKCQLITVNKIALQLFLFFIFFFSM